MSIRKLLRTTGHRPWKLPEEKWKFYQEWKDVIFLHWPAGIDELRRYVPEELEIDLFEGMPWVTLVAFSMKNVRARYLPAFPPVSNFHEINFRTYVKSGGKEGIYFLSMECSKKISTLISKVISGLPYRYSVMARIDDTFKSGNTEFNDKLDLKYSSGNNLIQKDTLDKWLTERYALFQDIDGTIRKLEIHHPEWPIKNISFENIDIHYPRFMDLIDNVPDRTHFSNGVNVVAWGKK